MERRVVFSGRLFPVLLLAPQLAVTCVFFFWPAAQAILQSVQRGDAFGLSTRFVGLENFAVILADRSTLLRSRSLRFSVSQSRFWR
jgi:sn-glycerol 3-phosphate transport system permease protein